MAATHSFAPASAMRTHVFIDGKAAEILKSCHLIPARTDRWSNVPACPQRTAGKCAANSNVTGSNDPALQRGTAPNTNPEETPASPLGGSFPASFPVLAKLLYGVVLGPATRESMKMGLDSGARFFGPAPLENRGPARACDSRQIPTLSSHQHDEKFIPLMSLSDPNRNSRPLKTQTLPIIK